jgi:hypothetical protein
VKKKTEDALKVRYQLHLFETLERSYKLEKLQAASFRLQAEGSRRSLTS